MVEYPIVVAFNSENLTSILDRFQKIRLITTEKRIQVSGDFPTHTRYFTNGDRPLVALVKQNGAAKFWYGTMKEGLIIPDQTLIFFDDSVPHSWSFEKCDLEIYYYRLTDDENLGSTTGDYCLDDYF